MVPVLKTLAFNLFQSICYFRVATWCKPFLPLVGFTTAPPPYFLFQTKLILFQPLKHLLLDFKIEHTINQYTRNIAYRPPYSKVLHCSSNFGGKICLKSFSKAISIASFRGASTKIFLRHELL